MKKVLAILLATVMLFSLTVTAVNAESGDPSAKITAKLAEKIASAAEGDKLPVAVTADLSISAAEREVCERYAAEQADVPYGGYLDYFTVDDNLNSLTAEEKKQHLADGPKWKSYEAILYDQLRNARLTKINSVLDAIGADADDIDGGYYTTACLLLPKTMMLTAAQINTAAALDAVTRLDLGSTTAPVQKDISKIITKELAAKLAEVGGNERVNVKLSYGTFESPYKAVYTSNDTYEPTDRIIKEIYGFGTANLSRVTNFALWHNCNVARKYIQNDFSQDYMKPLRLKALDLSEDDTYVYYEDGTPNITLLKLTEAKLYDVIQKGNVTKAEFVKDPYEDPPVPAEPSPGYFIVGTMTDWKLDSHYKIGGDVGLDKTLGFTLFLTQDDSFKIVYSPDGKTLDNATYYPPGRGNAFNQESPIILRNTIYTFLFRPACDGGITYFFNSSWWDEGGVQTWYYNCIYCRGYDPWETYSSPNLPNPDPDHNEPEPGYYIVGTMTDWQLNKNYRFSDASTEPGFTQAEFGKWIMLRRCDEFKIAYSEDGVNITRWYPEGEGNAFNQDVRRIRSDHNLVIIYFSPYGIVMDGSDGSSHYGMISTIYAEYGGENAQLQLPAEGELFKAKLKADYSLSEEDFSEYEELCYHKDKEGVTDWVLLKTKTSDASEQAYSDVIANRAFVQAQTSAPFGSSYAVYDVAQKSFINLTGDIVARYKDLGRIFDKVGEGRLIGDVDGDNELTAIDCTLMQRCVTLLSNWPENDYIADTELRGKLNTEYYSDFDRNGERDIVDATRLQRYVIYID